MPDPNPPTPRIVVRPTTADRRWPEVTLLHGESPAQAAARSVGAPVAVVAPHAADVVDDVLVLTLRVRPDPRADTDAGPDDGRPAVRFRRVAAYAIVRDDDRVLMTQLAEATPAPGAWTLPGGGIDPGESPLAAVLREVHEETAHDLVAPRLVHVDSWRFTGMAPSGRLEDFHGIGIIYAAAVSQVREPRVLDVGGSTAAAAWVPLADLPHLNLGRRRGWLLQVLGLGPQPEA